MGSVTPPPLGASVTAKPAWGSLVEEADVPPVWAERIPLAYADGRRNRRWSLWLTAQAWRTRRMDISLVCEDATLWEQQAEIFEALATEIVAALDWTLNVRCEAKIDYSEEQVDPFRAAACVRKLIIQVGDGHQLEGPINLIARFKERWS